MPWNFPFALPLRTIIPALLAGNAVVFKPSEITPRTGKLVAELFEGARAGGLVGLVQGGGDAGAALVRAPTSTSSSSPAASASGRKVAHACAERLIPCSLELGGKDAAIVLADADLERAANGIVWGAMINAGQNCGADRARLRREEDRRRPSRRRSSAADEALRVGDDVGPLTTEAQRDIVERHVEAAKSAGRRGPRRAASRSRRARLGFQPTVVKHRRRRHPLITDETFGPVLPITASPTRTKPSGARTPRATASPRASGRRTSDAARSSRSGSAPASSPINNHSFTGALPSAPWGGVGETGWGITSSPLALEHLTRPRFVLVDRNRAAARCGGTRTRDTLDEARARVRAPSRRRAFVGARIGALFALDRALAEAHGRAEGGDQSAAAGAAGRRRLP